jgi:beta-glucanase (GH16 family)
MMMLGLVVAPAEGARIVPAIDVAQSAVSGRSIVVSATMPKSQKGRKLVLQRRTGSKWVTVRSTKLPRSGWVQFTVPKKVSGRVAQYRLKANPYRGEGRAYSAAVSGAQLKRVFNDNFSGTRINSAKWAVRLPGEYFGLRQCAAASSKLPKVYRGKVQLKVAKTSLRKAGCPKGVFVNTMIGTQESYSAKYGTFAARIKFSPYQGQHASFWMQGEKEIDIVEFFGLGRRDSGLAAFVHWDDTKVGGIRNLKGIMARGKNPANSYHVYSVDWTPTRYVFRIDGKVVLNTTRGVSSSPQYMILSALTSDWEIPLLNQKRLPTTTYVDWVRVWQTR